MVKDGHVAKIPKGMSFEDAATLGTGVTTIGQTLYMTMKLPLPSQPTKLPIPILIYGGSTAAGTLAIQYAKLFVFHPPSPKPADP
jgi:NADPH:quinone reductase-like Zn-dependent oxidoreductase